jgi:SAM-dependent methyltransferase
MRMKKECRLCGTKLPHEAYFQLTGVPSGAQYYPKSEDFVDDKGACLNLLVCPSCDLYQLDSDAVPYYRDVIRSGGYSKTMLDLRNRQYSEMMERFALINKKVFECGCGQGEFLGIWKRFPIDAYGIEHDASLVNKARANGLNVANFFIDDYSLPSLPNAPFDAFTSFNFLEHQPNPNGMLKAIYKNLTHNGGGLITVPSLEYILKNNAYYELVIDHLMYFSRKTLITILEKNGFQVVGFDETLDDTLSAYVIKNNNGKETLNDSKVHLTEKIQNYIARTNQSKGHIVVWGASHQAFTILTSTGIDKYISFIVDSAPFKQGRYSPVSHIPISAPEILHREEIATIIIIAPNYTEEILMLIRDEYRLTCPVASIQNGKISVREMV